MTHNITESRITFFREYFQMAMYSTATNQVEKAYILRCSSNEQQYYKLWLGAGGLLNVALTTKPTGASYIVRTYRFDLLDYGDIWLDDTALVIGTGDIRNKNLIGMLHTFNLVVSEANAVIITCDGPYRITVYAKSAPVTDTILMSTIDNNPCPL